MSYIIDFIPYIISFGLTVLLAIINCLTRGRYKSILKEVQKLITYRNADYRMNSEDEPQGTKFSNLIPQFRLNKASGILEEAEPLDITALANSARNVELKELLSKLEAGTAELTQQLKTKYEDYTDDLDELANALDVAEEYRERFGMSEDISVSDIFARIEQERDKLKQSLENVTKAQAASPAQSEEVKDNAQKDDSSQE